MEFNQTIFSGVLNIIFMILLFISLKLNPSKPTFKDLGVWIKLKLYKNSSIHRIIYPNGTEREYFLKNPSDTTEQNYDGNNKRTYILNRKIVTSRNNVPIYTHLLDNVEGVDYFNDIETKKFSSEKFYKIISVTKTLDVDFIRKIIEWKNVGKIAGAIAIGSIAAAILSFQILNKINSMALCVMPTILN